MQQHNAKVRPPLSYPYRQEPTVTSKIFVCGKGSTCTYCGKKSVFSINYAQQCVECGTEHSTDYLERDVNYTENEVMQQPLKDVVHENILSDEMHWSNWLYFPDSVTSTANELFRDFSKDTACVAKGGHRINLIIACLFFSQNIMNSGRQSKKYFTDHVLDVAGFGTACNEVENYVFISGSSSSNVGTRSCWSHLLPTDRPISFGDEIGRILREFGIETEDEVQVRKRSNQINDLMTAAPQKLKTKVDGVKNSILHVAVVYTACESLKIKVPIEKSRLATVKRIVYVIGEMMRASKSKK